MRTILVTGGAGFIGSHLCERLIERGDRVTCFDNFDPYYDPVRKERNIASLGGHPRFKLVRGSIVDAAHLEEILEKHRVDGVVHLAARAGVRPSLEQPAAYQEVNVTGTTNVLEAARKAGIRSVVLASSSSVYGANTKVPFSESDPVEQPISPYAASKRACELMAHVYHAIYGMDVICHRFFTVYGPRQRPDMAISKFIDRVQRGATIDIYGDGSTRRDYTYVDDIVSGVIASVDRAEGMGFQIFNLGNSQTVALCELVDAVGCALDREPLLKYRPEQPGDVKITYANTEKARRMLGYAPATLIEVGLARYVEWLRSESPVHVAA